MVKHFSVLKQHFDHLGLRWGPGDLEIMYKTEEKFPSEVQVLASLGVLITC